MRSWTGALLMVMVACGGGDQSWTFDDVSAVDLEVSSGEITVVPSLDGRAHVSWSGGGVGDNARPDVILLDNGTLIVDAAGGILGGGELEVEVPEGASVRAHAQRGEVDIALSMPADVDACVGAGEVTIAVPAGGYYIDASLGAGKLSGELVHDPDARHTLSVCAGAGEISLEVYEDPEQ
jgi:hypothetical protein